MAGWRLRPPHYRNHSRLDALIAKGAELKMMKRTVQYIGTIYEMKMHTWGEERRFEDTFYMETKDFKSDVPLKRDYMEIFHTEEYQQLVGTQRLSSMGHKQEDLVCSRRRYFLY
ncbi:hypothetical protein HPY27_29200 [Brevibacillus sp. HB1.1]|uniref:hypothetical protein n=1 Tax=Brevibacillus sp. HB1.1 TaxID=2738808 RepID=UPI001576FF6C|nr:hypothetical protein [Brevibacillus sp. HB1.1]NTU34244.1 hypothetical protein [Brevibacillus sp. HB1.1]